MILENLHFLVKLFTKDYLHSKSTNTFQTLRIFELIFKRFFLQKLHRNGTPLGKLELQSKAIEYLKRNKMTKFYKRLHETMF